MPMVVQVDEGGALTAVLADFGYAMLSDPAEFGRETTESRRISTTVSETQGLHRFELNVGTPAFLA